MIGTILKSKVAGSPPPTGEASLPEVRLEVAFASNPTDEVQVFTLVSSDTTGRQIEFSTKRGRQDELKNPETGTMLTSLYNQDRRFDPAYSLSPYFPNVLPVRQARLSAVWAGQTYYLFRGDIEEWPQKWDGRKNQAVLQANDAFDAISQVEIEIDRPEEYSGARIAAILNAIQWPISQRAIQPGKSLLHANKYSGNALELLRRVVSDEDGYFFISGSGNATFIERHARFKPPYTTPWFTLSNRPTGDQLPLSDADVQVDKDFLKNQVKVEVEPVVETQLDTEGNPIEVTVKESVEFFEQDPTSMAQFRPRTLQFPESMLANLNEAGVKAQYHLARLKDPQVRVRSVVIEPQLNDLLWVQVLTREIGDRIGVILYPPQTGTEEAILFEGIIEYVEHRSVVGTWRTTWYLSPADLNDYWILDSTTLSVLGTTTKIGY